MTERLTVRLPRPVTAVRVVSGDGSPCGASTSPGAPGQDAEARENAAEMLQGLRLQRIQLAQAGKALLDGVEKLADLRQEMIRQSEQQLLELSLEIAKKVLMQEIQAGRYEVDPIVKEALLHVPARQDVVVHLHPDDWAACQMAREADGSASAGKVRFVADPGVRRAECRLETCEGIVESDVEGHLAGIAEALRSTE